MLETCRVHVELKTEPINLIDTCRKGDSESCNVASGVGILIYIYNLPSDS